MSKRIILTIHGIRYKVYGDWQGKIGELVNDEDTIVDHYRYGRVYGVWAWLLSNDWLLKLTGKFKKKYVDGFANEIKELQKQFPDAEVSVVAHSFGTWITYEMLETHKDIKLRNLVLVGAVIPENIESTRLWSFFEKGRIKTIHNWCSYNDNVVKDIAIKPFGKAGYWGFVRWDKKEDYQSPPVQPYASINLFNDRHSEDHGGAFSKFASKIAEQLKA